MLTSPQSITINAVAKDLHRTIDERTSSTYQDAGSELMLKVSHQQAKTRIRRMARIDQTKIAADPLTAISQYATAGVYLVIDEPEFGFTSNEIQYLVEGLKTWLSSTNIQAMLANRH